jgi:hypothetical protein
MTKEIQAAYRPYNPERIRVPALAIYAVPKSADDLMRRGSSDRLAFPELVARAAGDPAIGEGVEKLFLLTRARVSASTRTGSRLSLSEGVWWNSQAHTISSSAISAKSSSRLSIRVVTPLTRNRPESRQRPLERTANRDADIVVSAGELQHLPACRESLE